jgi:hypothetical protein
MNELLICHFAVSDAVGEFCEAKAPRVDV